MCTVFAQIYLSQYWELNLRYGKGAPGLVGRQFTFLSIPILAVPIPFTFVDKGINFFIFTLNTNIQYALPCIRAIFCQCADVIGCAFCRAHIFKLCQSVSCHIMTSADNEGVAVVVAVAIASVQGSQARSPLLRP